MVRITIDEELRKKLFSSGEPVELVDESGNLLGRLVPEMDRIPEGWAPITPPISEEELLRRLNSNEPGISTDELLARLRANQ